MESIRRTHRRKHEGTVSKIFDSRIPESKRVHGMVELDNGKQIEFSGYFNKIDVHEMKIGTRIRGTRILKKGREVLRNARRLW